MTAAATVLRTFPLVLALGLASAETAVAHAPFAGAEIPAHRITASGGWDPTWVIALGYGHRLPAIFDRPLVLDAALTVPVLVQPDARAWKLALGATTLIIGRHNLGAATSLHGSMAATHDPTGSKLGLGYELGVQPGYYGRRWTLAADFAWRSVLATRMWHSDVVRDLFRDRYQTERPSPTPTVNDGWYRFAANRLRAGAVAARRIGNRAGVMALVAYEHTFQEQGILANPAFGQLPFCLLLGGHHSW